MPYWARSLRCFAVTCAQCKGPVDGQERLCAVEDDMVWLHPQCERFYMAADDLPW
jgi:hypothetical protein